MELIVKVLNVLLFIFFINDIDIDLFIFKKKDWKKVYWENNDYIVYDVLIFDFMKVCIEMLMMDLNKWVNIIESYYFYEDKEEIVVIMKGEVYVELEGKEYYLEEGDVVCILLNVKYWFLNKSDELNYILFVLILFLGWKYSDF